MASKDDSEQYTFSELLRQFRGRERVSQQELADKLAIHRNTIGAWERGDNLPASRAIVLELAKALHLSPKDTDHLLYACFREPAQGLSGGEGTSLNIHQIPWAVTYRRNLFFTGREELLAHLHQALHREKAVALTLSYALSGLGGIGKTQIALEYAYRYQHDYQAVLWATADTAETLMTDFVKFANALHLPQRNEQDQNVVVQAVKQWLEQHEKWLLIVDNADDFSLLPHFLPKKGEGHILLTTRAQATGSLAIRVQVEKMGVDEGILFLLRRAKMLALDAPLETVPLADQLHAQAIVYALDGLPLALEQVGAYIEETGCGLRDYLERYTPHHMTLLKRRSQVPSEYSETVATTWAFSFEKVEQMSNVAADLLRCCAFLSPDAIPEEMFTGAASKLGLGLEMLEQNPLAFDHVISILQRYSLVRRIADQRLVTIHRLVQTVLRDAMTLEQQRQWAERTLGVINHLFPEVNPAMWHQCQRYLSHAEVCATLIDQYHIVSLEAWQLLTKAGSYLEARSQYKQAELLFRQALEINEQILGPENKNVADSLDHLAWVLWRQSKFDGAEALYKRALKIREEIFGYDSPEVAQSYDNLAGLYREQQGKDAQAEAWQKQVIGIFERTLGDHTRTAAALHNLGWLYTMQGKYTAGEELFRRSLAINEKINGEKHLTTAVDLFGLGWVCSKLDRDEEAEALYRRSLHVREELEGPEHPDTAQVLQVLGVLYRKQGKLGEAETFLQRAVNIYRSVLGTYDPNTAQAVLRLGLVYSDQSKDEQAEALLKQARAIYEQTVGLYHSNTAISINSLASLYARAGKYELAKSLYEQALAIYEHVNRSDHPNAANTLRGLACLYRDRGQYEQAKPLYQQAVTIYEQAFGKEHFDTIATKELYSTLLEHMQNEGIPSSEL